MSVSSDVKGLHGWPDAFLASLEQQATAAFTAKFAAKYDKMYALHPGAEISVTPEMIAAAEAVFHAHRGQPNRLAAIYRAMAALAPVELISAGELAALKERDEALAMRDETLLSNARARFRVCSVLRENEELCEKVADRNARIAELEAERTQYRADMREQLQQYQDVMDLVGRMDGEIAALRGEKFVPDPPKAKPNPFREFGGDRRRIGG